MSSSPPTSATAAGEAGNDDVEECDDAIDDCSQDRADTIHNGHQDATDGSADSLELWHVSMLCTRWWIENNIHMIRRHPL